MAQSNRGNSHSFANKWSVAIEKHGFTSLPNLVLTHRKTLGITPTELTILFAIESFRWDDRHPYPSLDTISHKAGFTPRYTRAVITTLVHKKLVVRIGRNAETNLYSVEPLIYRLDQIATSSIPRGQKQPPGWAETRSERGMKSSPKEDAAKDPSIKTRGKDGLLSIGDILSRKPP